MRYLALAVILLLAACGSATEPEVTELRLTAVNSQPLPVTAEAVHGPLRYRMVVASGGLRFYAGRFTLSVVREYWEDEAGRSRRWMADTVAAGGTYRDASGTRTLTYAAGRLEGGGRTEAVAIGDYRTTLLNVITVGDIRFDTLMWRRH